MENCMFLSFLVVGIIVLGTVMFGGYCIGKAGGKD